MSLQHRSCLNFSRVMKFVKFIMEINQPGVIRGEQIHEYLDIVKINRDDRNRLINGYSHGMKNKLQMLSFIIAKPPVILLDEPLTSFDVVVALEMKNLLKKMKQDHILIFSTHILQLAVDLCDEIVVLNQGKLSKIDSEKIHSEAFEEEIFAILKDGGDADFFGFGLSALIFRFFPSCMVNAISMAVHYFDIDSRSWRVLLYCQISPLSDGGT